MMRVPGVGDVVVVAWVPHEEHVVPLGDDLTVGGQGLGALVLVNTINCIMFTA